MASFGNCYQEWELHKPYSWIKCEAVIVGRIVNRGCALTIQTLFPFFPLLLHWIKKQSHHGHLLEHLKSSGTKIKMRGPIVRQLCVQDTEKQTKNILEDEFCRFKFFSFVWFTAIAKDLRLILCIFGAYFGWNHHLCIYEAADVSFAEM